MNEERENIERLKARDIADAKLSGACANPRCKTLSNRPFPTTKRGVGDHAKALRLEVRIGDGPGGALILNITSPTFP